MAVEDDQELKRILSEAEVVYREFLSKIEELQRERDHVYQMAVQAMDRKKIEESKKLLEIF